MSGRLDREAELIAGLPERLRQVIRRRLHREAGEVEGLRDRSRRRVRTLIDHGRNDLDHVHARVRALSPQATLERGYAVVRTDSGTVVRAPAEATGRLRITVAAGEFTAEAIASDPS